MQPRQVFGRSVGVTSANALNQFFGVLLHRLNHDASLRCFVRACREAPMCAGRSIDTSRVCRPECCVHALHDNMVMLTSAGGQYRLQHEILQFHSSRRISARTRLAHPTVARTMALAKQSSRAAKPTCRLGRWENDVHLDRKDRLCLVCSSAQDVEDDHHFLFDCPAYSSIRASHANLFQCACSVSGFFDNCEANACGGFIRNCFSLRSSI